MFSKSPKKVGYLVFINKLFSQKNLKKKDTQNRFLKSPNFFHKRTKKGDVRTVECLLALCHLKCKQGKLGFGLGGLCGERSLKQNKHNSSLSHPRAV